MNKSLNLSVRQARTKKEKRRIYEFRYRVYVRELGKDNLPGIDHDHECMVDDLDETAMQFYAEVDGEVVAALRVNLGADGGIPEDFGAVYRTEQFSAFPVSAFSFSSRLMVSPEMRGRSALHRLLGRTYEVLLGKGTLFDFCNAAPALVELYQLLGYRRFTDNFVDPAVGYRVPMLLLVRDAAHLQKVRSPFWRHLKNKPELWQADDIAVWLGENFPGVQHATELAENEEMFWDFLGDRLQLGKEGIPLLNELTDKEQKHILRSGALLECQPGDAIIRAGDKGREMFVIVSGIVDVRSPGGETSLAVFGPGHVFGEIAFLADTTRTADVIALTEAEILVVSQAYLRKLRKASPELAAKVLMNLSRILCERLVCSSQALADRERP